VAAPMADLDRSKHEGTVIHGKSMHRGQMRASMADGGNIPGFDSHRLPSPSRMRRLPAASGFARR